MIKNCKNTNEKISTHATVHELLHKPEPWFLYFFLSFCLSVCLSVCLFLSFFLCVRDNIVTMRKLKQTYWIIQTLKQRKLSKKKADTQKRVFGYLSSYSISYLASYSNLQLVIWLRDKQTQFCSYPQNLILSTNVWTMLIAFW